MAERNTVQESKTYHVIRDGRAYHYIRSEVKDDTGEYMWLNIKEILVDNQQEAVALGYISKSIVQMAIDQEAERVQAENV